MEKNWWFRNPKPKRLKYLFVSLLDKKVYIEDKDKLWKELIDFK